MKTLKYIFLFLGMTSLLVSCKDYLDRSPLDQLDPKVFFSSQANALIAVNGVYNAAIESVKGRTYSIDLDCMTDNMYNYSRNQNTQEFGQGSHGASSVYALNMWSRGYKGVSRANVVLAYLDQCYERDTPTTNIKERLRAEALFLRAFFYAELVDFFGDVPMYLTPVDISGSLPRTPKAEVVNRILADLDAAKDNLPVRYEKVDVGRATKGAALTLMGRVQLYNGMYDEAAQTLKQVIELKDEQGQKRYSLYNLYREMFLPQHENSDEIIFDIQYIKGAYTQGLSHQMYTFIYEWNSYCPTVSMADAYYTKGGFPVTYDEQTKKYTSKDPAFDPTYPLSNRDPRLEMSIMIPASDNGRGGKFIPGSSNHTGMKIRKWNDYTETEKNNSEHNIILMRYAEVLLMRAEALVESGTYVESEVMDLVNQVRQRPGVMMPKVEAVEGKNGTLTAEELIDIIRHEFRVEFAFEGRRISDIRRWKIGEDVMIDAIGYDYNKAKLSPPVYECKKVDTRSFNPARDYVWPIPQNEINTNPFINAANQNPNY